MRLTARSMAQLAARWISGLFDASVATIDTAMVTWRTRRRRSSNSLLESVRRHTLSYMKTSALTIRLDPELEKRLERAAERSGRTRSDIAREALRRQLALTQFEELRKRMMPFAEAAGYLTDEDVFRDVS